MPREPIIVGRCYCGCRMNVTRPARFMPGHAVALANRLRSVAINGDSNAREALQQFGWRVPEVRIRPTFGVESEFFGIRRGDAVRALRNAGLSAEDDGYHHEARSYWRVTDDGSVANEGNELVSPILLRTRKQHEAQLMTALATLSARGGVTDATCGTHVHHPALHLNPEQVANVLATYAYFQRTINKVLHPRRQLASYAEPISNPSHWWDRLSRYNSTDALRSNCYSFARYQSVNLNALAAHGTLEFRQMEGSLNPQRVMDWVDLTGLIMQVNKLHASWTEAPALFGTEATPDVVDMLGYLGAPMPLAGRIIARADQLASNNGWDTEDWNNDNDSSDEYDDETWCDHCDNGNHSTDDCGEYEGWRDNGCECRSCNRYRDEAAADVDV